MTRRFAAKDKIRFAGEMSCQPGQLYIRAIAGQAVGATVAPWVEQLLRECGLQCIGQAFGQFGIGHQCPSMAFLSGLSETGVKYIVSR